MKKLSLSVVVATALSTTLMAGITLYEDPKTHQIFTQPAEGRVMIGDFIDAKSVDMADRKIESKISKMKSKKGVKVKTKAGLLKFNGKHYLGFVNKNPQNGESTSYFETRRNYFQVKAYFLEDPKSYLRVTLDTHQVHEGTSDVDLGDDSWSVRLKYAYLYLNNILPNTGVEFGQVHRPWIDYEEHHGWWYRSIDKVYVEAGESAHYTNSADLGVNFKTKFDNFSSELGVFNGEGYHYSDDHKVEENAGLSAEWRLTYHPLGTGKKKVHQRTDEYLDFSFFGQNNRDFGKSNDIKANSDFNWWGLHAVYNNEKFLLAAQYVDGDNDNVKYQGDGYSINGEYRLSGQWMLIGRYDSYDADEKKSNDDKGGDREHWLAGVVYDYNKNVRMIANYMETSYDDSQNGSTWSGKNGSSDWKKYMLTAEVSW